MAMYATDIEWDADVSERIKNGLPVNVEIPEDILKDVPEEEIGEVVSDWLSDTYGFCHKGFAISIINPDDRHSFEQKCYEAYQLDWMMSHGYKIRDIVNAMGYADSEIMADDDRCLYGDSFDQMKTLYDQFEYENGFDGEGSIWACKSEFLDNEYRDPEYMEHLLGQMANVPDRRRLWEKYTGLRLPEKCLAVSTTAGVIKAYKNEDPGQPGIYVMLQPAGYEDEIDVAYASVYEDPDFSLHGERPVDVCIMTYADATQEDYTSKEFIRREDVIAGLGTEWKV